jgi:hypothetical protein
VIAAVDTNRNNKTGNINNTQKKQFASAEKKTTGM